MVLEVALLIREEHPSNPTRPALFYSFQIGPELVAEATTPGSHSSFWGWHAGTQLVALPERSTNARGKVASIKRLSNLFSAGSGELFFSLETLDWRGLGYKDLRPCELNVLSPGGLLAPVRRGHLVFTAKGQSVGHPQGPGPGDKGCSVWVRLHKWGL